MQPDLHVWILDDHPLVVQAIRALILQQASHAQITTFGSIKELLAYSKTHPSPDVLLLDWHLPDGSAIDVLGAFDAKCTEQASDRHLGTTQFIIVSAGDPAEIEAKLMRLQGSQPLIVYKHQAMHELSMHIRAAVLGKAQPAVQLTSRQKDVLVLIEQGMKNADIAERLYISEFTVKAHLAEIFKKLQVQSRTQAVHKWKLLA